MISTGPGIACPSCAAAESSVVDSRPGENYIRRRRLCSCRSKFWTIEIVFDGTEPGAPEPVMGAMRVQAMLNKLPANRRNLFFGLLCELAREPEA